MTASDLNITNKNYALITGGTSGIGYHLAKIFAEHKYNLIIVARTVDVLERVARELTKKFGVNVISISKNLSQENAPFELYDEIKSKGLVVDVLVNNAGQTVYGKFVDTDIKDELDIVQLNINAYVLLTKLFLRDMVKNQHGKILNVASIAGKVPGPYQAVYHGTKAFIHSFTEAIRAENTDIGLTITSLLPGLTATDIFHKADMEASKILNTGLADPADVARDGFNVLMSGDDRVVSGLKNKIQVASANIIPDEVLADQILKQQETREFH